MTVLDQETSELFLKSPAYREVKNRCDFLEKEFDIAQAKLAEAKSILGNITRIEHKRLENQKS